MFKIPRHYSKTLRMYSDLLKKGTEEGRDWPLTQLKDISSALSVMAAMDPMITGREFKALNSYASRVRREWFYAITNLDRSK
jgi:hypothetical protein